MLGGCADIYLLQGAGVLRLEKKDANEVVGGCADNDAVKGAGGVWLGKWRLVCGRWYGLGCGLGCCLEYEAAQGAGSPAADPLRVRIAGYSVPLGKCGRCGAAC